MGQVEKSVADTLIAIVDPERGKRFPVYSGKVVAGSVDNDLMTCNVELSVNDEGVPTEGVLLNVTLEGGEGFALLPSDNAIVLVAEVDGPGKYCILKCSQYYGARFKANQYVNFQSGSNQFYVSPSQTRMDFGASSKLVLDSNGSVFNNGSFGGVPKVVPLVNDLNELQADINILKGLIAAAVTSIVAAGVSSPLAPVTNLTLSGYFSTFAGYSASALALSLRTLLENTDVKHGPHG